MRFDLSGLNHQKQREFLESVKNIFIEDNYYKVFFDFGTNEFLLIRPDYVVKNANSTIDFMI